VDELELPVDGIEEFVEVATERAGLLARATPGAQPDGPSGNQEEQPTDDRDERLEAHTAAGRARLRHLRRYSAAL
jgi:hypothetical protein